MAEVTERLLILLPVYIQPNSDLRNIEIFFSAINLNIRKEIYFKIFVAFRINL